MEEGKDKFGRFMKGYIPHSKGKTKDNYEPLKRAGVTQSITKKKLYAEGKLVAYNKGKKNPTLLKRNLENNPMNDPKIRKKASKTRLRLFKEGKIKQWCKGKTKETDERVRKQAEKLTGIKRSEKTKNRIRKTRKDKMIGIGKNNPFYGKTHNNKTKKEMSAIKQGITIKEWEKFTSFEPYDKNFNKQFKKLIKKRDECCMLCNIGFEDLKLLKRRVHVHHINYNKLLSIPQNCISLCNSCHSKTNTNRKHWINFFQSLLTERYNYTYSKDKKIILGVENVTK